MSEWIIKEIGLGVMVHLLDKSFDISVVINHNDLAEVTFLLDRLDRLQPRHWF